MMVSSVRRVYCTLVLVLTAAAALSTSVSAVQSAALFAKTRERECAIGPSFVVTQSRPWRASLMERFIESLTPMPDLPWVLKLAATPIVADSTQEHASP